MESKWVWSLPRRYLKTNTDWLRGFVYLLLLQSVCLNLFWTSAALFRINGNYEMGEHHSQWCFYLFSYIIKNSRSSESFLRIPEVVRGLKQKSKCLFLEQIGCLNATVQHSLQTAELSLITLLICSWKVLLTFVYTKRSVARYSGNPALWIPAYYGQPCLSRKPHMFSLSFISLLITDTS